jgi:hypothetical protein
MTVLAHVWTPEGFVVGADGLVRNGKTGCVEICNKKKLIRLKRPGVDLICGWSGGSRIKFSDGRRFDLTKETKRIGDILPDEQCGEHYVERLSEALLHSISKEIMNNLSEVETWGLFVGYVNNRAQHWIWKFAEDSVPQKKHSIDAEHSFCVLSGQHVCEHRLQCDATTLKEGARNLCRYIKCCEGFDSTVGGRTRILTIPVASLQGGQNAQA